MSLLSRLAVQAARAYGILSARSTNVSASYLVVAGGGGGGNVFYGGGGGGGGVISSTASLSTLNTYSITVGAGGTGGNNGNNSVISGTGLTTITSVAGGAGGSNGAGNNGGSGGGGSNNSSGGTGTSGQGNNGGSTSTNNGSGGGGGASAVGSNGGTNTGGAGGAGLTTSISGSSQVYGSGGGGGAATTGASGGTNAGNGASGTGNPTSATANFGGGGGGGGASVNGGSGGSGIVIISYASATPKFVGGTLTTSGGNQIHTFTSSGTLSPLTPVTASYLVVAGGGGGGNNFAGGGGAGGYQASSTTLYSGATYVVTVGSGGTGSTTPGGNGTQGTNSVLSGTGLTTLTSTGGGGGQGDGNSTTGINGGSGGGASKAVGTAGTGTSGQGNNGGAGATTSGGGGGGAGAAGSSGSGNSGGNGGIGSASSISGTSTYYAGGGGGGAYLGTRGSGGTGGGGNGGDRLSGTNRPAEPGTPNTGGGGGGGNWDGYSNNNGANGGSGVVIISYAGSQVFNGGLVTSSGGNTIHTFTATGALTPLTNNLNNSLRFRSSASAFLNRTPTVTGNQKTFTWSGWVKRGALGSQQFIHHAFYGDSGRYSSIFFTSSDTLRVQSGVYTTGGSTSTSYDYITTQVFRDPSAWYHIVLAVDTTQATSSNRVKVYVNGSQITAFGTSTAPTQNDNTFFNITTTPMYIGKYAEAPGSSFLDGYLADINWVDGQALEPYYFGNNDANGVWKPIQYKGTYGTNGFYLTFGNTTSTTTLGYDSSPNGNNWTTNNISLTAGVTYDAMTDVPTNTSATVANYAVLNRIYTNTQGVATLSNANLKFTFTNLSTEAMVGTFGASTGKWYWEFIASANPVLVGIRQVNTTDRFSNSILWAGSSLSGSGEKYVNGTSSSYAGSSWTTGDVIGVAVDMDGGTVTFYKNNTSQGSINLSLATITDFVPAFNNGASTAFAGDVNFGQRPFSYTPPTGFVALNTYNLSTPTILQGNNGHKRQWQPEQPGQRGSFSCESSPRLNKGTG